MSVIRRAHPVRGESHIQRNTNQVFATIEIFPSFTETSFIFSEIDKRSQQFNNIPTMM